MTSASSPLSLDLPPMEAEAVDELPSEPGWQYEPKYDGFRRLAHRRCRCVHLQSKNQKPLERHLPEVAQGLKGITAVREVSFSRRDARHTEHRPAG